MACQAALNSKHTLHTVNLLRSFAFMACHQLYTAHEYDMLSSYHPELQSWHVKQLCSVSVVFIESRGHLICIHGCQADPIVCLTKYWPSSHSLVVHGSLHKDLFMPQGGSAALYSKHCSYRVDLPCSVAWHVMQTQPYAKCWASRHSLIVHTGLNKHLTLPPRGSAALAGQQSCQLPLHQAISSSGLTQLILCQTISALNARCLAHHTLWPRL